MTRTGNRTKWTRVIDALPPENKEVETKIDDHMGVRNQCILKRVGNSWFKGQDKVNWAPTHWRMKK